MSLGKLAEPAEIADIVAFAASERGRYLTGRTRRRGDGGGRLESVWWTLLKNSFFTDDGKILGVIRREARFRPGDT